MTDNLVENLVREVVDNLVFANRISYGTPLVTSDGFAISTIDDEILLAPGVTARRSSRPDRPLITSDGFALFDINDNLILGA